MRLGGLRLERALASKQYRDGSFHNTHDQRTGLEGASWPVMKELLFERAKRKPPGEIPVGTALDAWQRGPSGLRVTWLGHSTNVLELDGMRVLTDPVWGKRLGPVSFAGPRRFHAPPVAIAELPKLDAILISHDHFDHLCKSSVIELAKLEVPFVTSLGVGAYLEAYGVPAERIHELDWHERVEIGGLRFTATPAQHFSGRIGGRNATLWSSWVIETANHKIFFSGDTGLTPEFAETRAKYGPFDLVMLEIGAWHPAWGSVHLGPANALKAFELLGGGTLMPIHWATFDLGLNEWAEPAETLWTLAEATGQRIVTPRLGTPFHPAHVDRPEACWREVGFQLRTIELTAT